MQQRPDSVPGDAVWSAEDNEWERGERRGEHKVGAWTWWRADGTLCCESIFDEAGELHGVCRRYHPNGELSLVAPYVHGKLHGKQIATRPSQGTSPEMVELLALDEVWRLETLYLDGASQHGMTTLYARDGLFDPIACDAEGRALDLGAQLHKLRPGTAIELAVPFLDSMTGRIPRSKIKTAHYICLAMHGGSMHRVQITDRKGQASIEIVPDSAFESCSLAVDRAVAKLSQPT